MYNLIIQSSKLRSNQINYLANISYAKDIRKTHSNTIRLLNVRYDKNTKKMVKNYAENNFIDIAFIPEDIILSDFKILAMDMDSTLINIECIDEIADIIGVKSKVATITQNAMQGIIKNFSNSLRERVAFLKGTNIDILEYVYKKRLQLNPGSENLISVAKSLGIKIILLSGGFTFFTKLLHKRLDLDSSFGNSLEIFNRILTGHIKGRIIDENAKAYLLKNFAKKCNANFNEIIAIGDGANDIKMFEIAKYSVAYHAKPLVRYRARYAINFIGLNSILNWFDY